MADLFQPGALVMLKSGGPAMTVVRYKDMAAGHLCECKWFNAQKVEVADFHDAELKAHQPASFGVL